MPLESSILDFEVHGRMAEEGAEVQSIPDKREMEKTYVDMSISIG